MVATRRARKSAQQWAEIIKKFQSSGLSESEFCESLELSPVTFRKWRYKTSNRTNESPSTTSGNFAPITINQSDPRYCAKAVRNDLGSVVTIECDFLSISAIDNWHWRCVMDFSRWRRDQVWIYRHPVDMRKSIDRRNHKVVYRSARSSPE